jgi:hypothetical protein
MFVKFVHYPNEATGQKNTNEFTFECVDYSFHYDAGNYEEGVFFMAMKNGEQRQHRIVLHKTCVYVMSDTGKTIDSFSWIEDKPKNRCVRK